MNPARLFSHPPFAGAQRIGLPRAMLFHRYGTLWRTFFAELGKTVVVSRPTDRLIVERGGALANDESCLAGKIYLGHVESLVGECDTVFVPSIANVGRLQSFCTRFQSLPDLVTSTFADRDLRVLSCLVDVTAEKRSLRDGMLDAAEALGATTKAAKRAWAVAQKAHESEARAAASAQAAEVARIAAARKAAAKGGEHDGAAGEPPVTILLAAHPYLSHDPFVGGVIADIAASLGAVVLRADETDRKRALQKSFEFSQTLPWVVNRELIGSIMLLDDAVDGIVLASAFPCGPDSMTDDAVMRCLQGTPILNLTVDAQSGTAGLETRIESFVDILRYQKKGGYVHGS